MDRQVPTLSPNEEAWIAREYDEQIASNQGSYTNRAIDAMKSREYNVRVVREGLDKILRTLDALLHPRLLLKDGIEEWTRLAALFIYPSFWQSVEDLARQRRAEGADQWRERLL